LTCDGPWGSGPPEEGNTSPLHYHKQNNFPAWRGGINEELQFPASL
jgi:hypothetical protein